MLSKLLSRFGDSVGNRSARWLPLVLALEWIAKHGEDQASCLSGTQMFEHFLRLVANWTASPTRQ